MTLSTDTVLSEVQMWKDTVKHQTCFDSVYSDVTQKKISNCDQSISVCVLPDKIRVFFMYLITSQQL